MHFVAFHRYDDMSLDVTVKALVKHITVVYFIVCPPRHVFFCAEVTLFFYVTLYCTFKMAAMTSARRSRCRIQPCSLAAR